MSIHEELITRISIAIKRLESAGSLSPSTVALAVHQGLTDENIEVHVYYASLEHLKHMTRKVLAAKFGVLGSENSSIQNELFTELQSHYPTARKKGEDPVYKRKEILSYFEVQWNVAQLRKTGQAFLAHADGLDAWNENRGEIGLGYVGSA